MKAVMGQARAYFQTQIRRQTDECLIWPFGCAGGYGYLTVNGRHVGVHRLSCELTYGPPTQTERTPR